MKSEVRRVKIVPKSYDMVVRERPNPNVLYSAQAFRTAVMDLKKQADRDPVPVVVNALFSIELYLKSLNADRVYTILEDSPPAPMPGVSRLMSGNVESQSKGHNPSALFSSLATKYQDILVAAYKKTAMYSDQPDFKAALALYDGGFEAWRYSYEGGIGGMNLTRLINIMNFLDKAISEIPVEYLPSEP